MAKGGTVACLLPCTSFYLGAAYAPAREMVGAGVPVAMATDFNPGSCPCLNMQLVMNLGHFNFLPGLSGPPCFHKFYPA